MGAVQDRLVISLAEVKEYLRLPSDSTEDTTLQTLVDSAKEEADLYLNNPFVDVFGDPVAIPQTVKTWCLQWCGWAYTRRSLGVATEDVEDLGMIKWDKPEKTLLSGLRLTPGFGR